MSDQSPAPAEVKIYPTHDCRYVLRRFIVTADNAERAKTRDAVLKALALANLGIPASDIMSLAAAIMAVVPTSYPSLVSIPQRLFVKPEGEVYTGAKREEYDQPAQGNPNAKAIVGPGGRKMQEQSWQPMVGIWKDFPIGREREEMAPTPELAAEANATLRPPSE